MRKEHQLGQAGIFFAASQLCLRKIPFSFPAVDYGSDLHVAGSGIQVKTSSLVSMNRIRTIGYRFQLSQGRERREYDRPFVHILIGWPQHRVWVVPSDQLVDRVSLGIVATPGPRTEMYWYGFENDWSPFDKMACVTGSNLFDGKAGEFRACAELLSMGVQLSKPLVDDGTDLIASGMRLQVKSARLTARRNETPSYEFHFNNLRTRDISKSGKVKYSDSVDLFVLWGIDQDRFWIIPASEIDYLDTLTVGNEARWVDPEPVRRLRAEGKTYDAIGDELGIGTMTAWKKVNLEQNGREVATANLKQYENRWDLITGHARLMAASEAECSPTQVSVNV